MNSRATVNSAVDLTFWQASLQLQCQLRGNQTRLTRARHKGPLYVQRPFYPEAPECAHIYLLHPPGGIVSGDHLQIECSLEAGSQALLTTPGAGRFYRAREDASLQVQESRLRVADGSVLEWFPLETIVFDKANARQNTQIELQGSARFAAWEICCFGLAASDEPFVSGRFEQIYRVELDGRPLVIDRVACDGGSDWLQQRAAMASCGVNGFFVIGPLPADALNESLLERLRQDIFSPLAGMDEICSVTQLDRLLVGRYLGHSAERARRQFSAWWRTLRPLLNGREACPPRIWNT